MPRARRSAVRPPTASRPARATTKRPARVARRPADTASAQPAAADPRLVAAGWQHVRLALRDHGLLLQSDGALPNVAALVAGEAVRGSWWAHPASHSIFAVTQRLAAHPDALAVRLIDGKTTWVHRRLWPALLAVATAGDEWQVRGLSPGARALRIRLTRDGELRASGEPARELQQRLLALGEQEHTEQGHHETRLVSPAHWAARDVLPPPALATANGRLLLEQAARQLGGEGAVARLPWHTAESGARRAQQAHPTARGGRRRAAPGA